MFSASFWMIVGAVVVVSWAGAYAFVKKQTTWAYARIQALESHVGITPAPKA